MEELALSEVLEYLKEEKHKNDMIVDEV